MRMRTLGIGTLLLLSTVALVTAQNDGTAVFRECRTKELIDNDIPAAIRLCERVVREFASNSSLLADAHLQLGHLYESSDKAKAKQHYAAVAGMKDQPIKAVDAQKRLDAIEKDPYPRIEIPTPYTDDPFSFALSPDGLSVVYQATVNGKSQLWRWRDNKATPIAGTENARQWALPFWSPDGRSIGFFAEQKLKTIPVEGGKAKTLVAGLATPRGGTWNSDGVIVYSQNIGPLYRVQADGGEPTRATSPDAAQQNLFPRFSVDGQNFIYWKVNGAALNTTVGSLDGVTQTALSSGAGAVQVLPDHLYFVRAGSGNDVGVLSDQPIAFQKLEASGSSIVLGDSVGLDRRTPGLAALSGSAKGPLAFRAEATVNRQFVWMDRTGQEKGRLGPSDKSSPCCMRFSNDGEVVAFYRSVDHGTGSMWLLLANGERVRFRDAIQTMVFSPKGDEIAWTGFPSPASLNTALFRQPVNLLKGAGAAIITGTNSTRAYAQDWSGNDYILYRRNNQTTANDLLAISVKVSDSIPIATGPADEQNGRFSPDSQWVAYQSDEIGGSYEIYVQKFGALAESRERVSTSGGSIPQWSRDGRQLYFLSADYHVMVVDVTLGAEIELSAPRPLFPKPLRHGSTFEFTPDGQRLLVNTPIEDPAPIILLPNGPKRP